MTEHPDLNDDSSGQAGASTEIEITPQMIEAGRRALHASGLLSEEVVGAASEVIVVQEIFRAMIARRGSL